MQPGDDQATIGFTVPASLSALTVRYDLLAEIGRGGMGVVYKARDRQTGDLIAIKVIHPSIASDPLLIERFKNELLLARRITHKNVCRVYDLNDFGGAAVISMELVAGRSLRDLLRDVESVSIRRGLQIVRQIIAGLAEAHAQGVVHRDLKPENILVGRDGAVKIMDFGVAHLADSRNTATGVLVGTPAYMSPEQAEGKPADSRSDIYSLGLVMYEMFCGQPAFSGETPVALVAKHVGETAMPPREIEPDLPVRIDEAIRRCLEKNLDKRFPSVVELAASLAADGVASSTVPDRDTVPLPEHLSRWQKSDWGIIAAAALGLTVFFPCFARTSLAPRSQVTFDRTVLRRIAEEHLQRLGVPLTPLKQMSGGIDVGSFVYLSRQYGASVARDATNSPIHYWTWSVDFEGASLSVDHRGRVTAFSREAVPVDPGVLSFDDAKRQAAKALEDFFGQDASKLELEHETRGQVYGLSWLSPKSAQGLRERYSVDIDRLGVSSLRDYPELPPGYSLELFPFGEVTMNEWGLPVAVVISIVVSALGFFNRRRVAQAAPWRTAIAAISFVGAADLAYVAIFRPESIGIGIDVAVAVALGLLYAIVLFLGSITLEALLKKKGTWKLGTLIALFEQRTSKEASGLAFVRGTAIGLVLLGADTCAIWLGTTYFRARLSPVYIGLLGGLINTLAWPVGLVLATVFAQVMGIGLLVGFADTVATRLAGRRWIGILGAAALLAASGIRDSMGTVLPWHSTLLVLFVDYVILVLTFRLFDLLTLCVAVGTFAFWWANYPLLVMQQPIGAVGPWTAFVVWGLCVAGAIGVAFQSKLRRSYHRLAAAFD